MQMPSRPGLLASRWLRSLPFFIWHGVYLAALLAWRLPVFQDPLTLGTFAFFAAVGLTPLAMGLSSALGHLHNEDPPAWAGGLARRVLWLVCGSWMLVLTLVFYTSFRFGVEFTAPAFRSWISPLGPLELLVVGLAIWFPFRWQLEAVARCAIPTAPWFAPARGASPAPGESPPVVAPVPPLERPRPAGKGLWSAEIERFRLGFPWPGAFPGKLSLSELGRFGTRLSDFAWSALLLARGPLLAVLVVLFAPHPIASVLAVAAGLLASKVIVAWWAGGLGADPLHYLLGVDPRDQVFFDLKALLAFAVLPTVVVALLAALLAGAEPVRLALALLIGAVFLLRAGWYGLFRFSEFSAAGGCLLAFLASVLMVVLLVLGPALGAAGLLQTAALVGGVGFAGLSRRLWKLREPDLRSEMRRHAETSRDHR